MRGWGCFVPDLVVTSFAVGELQTFHKNPRVGAVAKIAESLQKRGQYRAIVVNVGTLTGRPFEVLAGNHTLLAARSLGWSRIDATTVDVSDEDAAQIVAADNRLADLGGYDEALLLELLEDAGDLSGTGYLDSDVAALARSLADPVALTGVDDAPELPAGEPVARLGDVFWLGPHCLYVGSCGDAERVAALPGGLVDCVWTDPPYGVNYVGGTGLTIQNDGLADAITVFELAVATMVRVSRPGAPVYVAHSDLVRGAFQAALEAAGVRVRQTLVWVKDRFVLGHADYHFQHEPLLQGDLPGWSPVAYGFAPGGEGRLGRGGEHWFGDNAQTTVFEVPRPKASREHPTMKPVDLIEPMLRNSCPAGGWVFDPFAGSGSTMIAAHRAGVRALMCELDPRYADVICRRWEEHTGVVPVRDGVPVSFA